MAYELASTNLVIELGIILTVLMGWQFTAAEYLGGLLMVIFIAVLFRLTLTPRLVQMAREQAEKGMMGRMEGHAVMDMSVSERVWEPGDSGDGKSQMGEHASGSRDFCESLGG